MQNFKPRKLLLRLWRHRNKCPRVFWRARAPLCKKIKKKKKKKRKKKSKRSREEKIKDLSPNKRPHLKAQNA